MTDATDPARLSPGLRMLLAALLLGAGGVPVLAAFDLGPLGVDDINGPPWLGLAAGGVFAAGGVAVAAGGRRPVVAHLAGLLILAGFAAIGNWIAFGAGERACGGSLFALGLEAEGAMRDLACRIPFGAGALVVNAVLIWSATLLLQRLAGGPPALARTRRAAEGLVLLGVAPLLLVAVVLAVVPVLAGVLRTRVRTGSWPRNEAFRARLRRRRRATAEEQ